VDIPRVEGALYEREESPARKAQGIEDAVPAHSVAFMTLGPAELPSAIAVSPDGARVAGAWGARVFVWSVDAVVAGTAVRAGGMGRLPPCWCPPTPPPPPPPPPPL
jgi:hypothetical protein